MINECKIDYTIKINSKTKNRLNNIIYSIMKSNILHDITHVIVQGDTVSSFGMALSAFNNKKKIIHLEAGLRTYDTYNPYPEEAYRQMISRITDIHLCPTEYNKQNLINERVAGKIYVVGNTGLDNIDNSDCSYDNKVLITLHRRENHDIMNMWFEELEKLAYIYKDVEFTIPIHSNPEIIKHKNIFKRVNVIKPLTHEEIINYIKKCKLIISDSGGLQEECSYLNKKIIICRKNTERTETLGTNGILCRCPSMLQDIFSKVYLDYYINQDSPYKIGKSWIKIKEIVES
jgi:UDP-N-acetylglucosamine 2-epimerase (non-hydrolysing)